MRNIKLLNPVSPVWNEVISENEYNLSPEAAEPEAIIVRSADMHSYTLEDSVWAVARAGVGVNNIPLDEYAQKGVVVFNTPGANANAVKELVLAGLLMAGRDIAGGIEWVKTLADKGDEVEKLVEKGKKAFVGCEIKNKTLGVIGLGAIGLQVANAAAALGMNVLGYDPYISVENAWKLSRAVKQAKSQDEIVENADFITIHVPLIDATKDTLNAAMFAKMKKGAAILNFARGELAVIDDVIAALESGQISRYVTDFPTAKLIGVKNVVLVPHLGASTPESEDNCVRMAAKQLDDYLNDGIIVNSVNFPAADPGKRTSPRIIVLHANVPNVVSSVTSRVSARNINISNMLNKSRGVHAVTILDLDGDPTDALINEIEALETVYNVRVLE